jgi:hypothetical protein
VIVSAGICCAKSTLFTAVITPAASRLKFGTREVPGAFGSGSGSFHKSAKFSSVGAAFPGAATAGIATTLPSEEGVVEEGTVVFPGLPGTAATC